MKILDKWYAMVVYCCCQSGTICQCADVHIACVLYIKHPSTKQSLVHAERLKKDWRI
jgi:hypothetical protein